MLGSLIALTALGGVSAAMAVNGQSAPMAASVQTTTTTPQSTARGATAAETAALRALYAATASPDPAAPTEEPPPASVTMPDHSNDVAAAESIIAPLPLVGVSMLFPVNAPVTSQFGLRLHPIFGDWRLHTGTDFGAPCGTPTISTRSGTVTFTGVVSGYGNRVVVDHGIVAGKRLETAYNHLSVIAVQAGQALVAGQPIGRVGTTGNSTGCHLHFEVRVDGAYTDAMPYLNGRPSTAVVTVPDVKATPTPTPTASTPPPTTPTPAPTASATPQSTPTPTATTTPEPAPTATTTPEPGDGDATTNGSASTTSTTDPAAAGSTNATD